MSKPYLTNFRKEVKIFISKLFKFRGYLALDIEWRILTCMKIQGKV